MFLWKRDEKYSHIWKDSRAFDPIFTGIERIKTVKTRKTILLIIMTTMKRIFIYLLLFLSGVMMKDLIPMKSRQTRNRATVPQSLTLLMNFKNDGTTSFQIMQGKSREFLL